MNETYYNPTQETGFPLKLKIKALSWKIINRTLFRWMPLQFRLYRIVLLRIFGATISKNVTISPYANIEHPWNLKMKDFSSLGDGCWIYCLDMITIGAKTCIGKDVYLITGTHDINSLTFELVTKPIVISEGCWVSTGAYILPGVFLDRYTVIGAKSVVSHNTESFGVYVGIPAKLLKFRKFA